MSIITPHSWSRKFQGEGGDLVHIEGKCVPELEGGMMVWSGNRSLEGVWTPVEIPIESRLFKRAV
jgi:hypothetical protein